MQISQIKIYWMEKRGRAKRKTHFLKDNVISENIFLFFDK